MPRRRAGRDEEIQIGRSTPAWMLTYADLITQLLIFFVLFITLSTLRVTKFKEMIIPLRGGTGIAAGEGGAARIIPPVLDEPQLLRVQEQILLYVKEKKLAQEIRMRLDERGLIISLAEQVMFNIGRDEILPKAKVHLDKISKILKPIPNNVRIEGHTCNIPIHTAQFPSNWELSTTRATNVTRYLIEQTNFSPVRISAAGYGEYHPVAPNNTEENKKLNRRVDIVVMWRRLQVLP